MGTVLDDDRRSLRSDEVVLDCGIVGHRDLHVDAFRQLLYLCLPIKQFGSKWVLRFASSGAAVVTRTTSRKDDLGAESSLDRRSEPVGDGGAPRKFNGAWLAIVKWDAAHTGPFAVILVAEDGE